MAALVFLSMVASQSAPPLHFTTSPSPWSSKIDDHCQVVLHARDLQANGLDELALAALIGPAWASDDVPLVLDRYRSGDTRASLARLFVLGQPVDAASLPVEPDRLAEAGLVDLDGATVRARVRLAPVGGLLVVHDGPSSDPDLVTGVSAASRTLATLTVRRPVERALDLGTGSGVQALLAARHARSVVATDLNPRALELARIGSELNDLPLDLRAGSLFEPAADELFDLIVSNPPFVLSPDNEFVFRDSDLHGDSICREVVRGAAEHLRPGGYATVLCNWICRTDQEPWESLLPWVEGLPCDALLVSHGAIDPLRYASRWNEPVRGDGDRYTAAVNRWLDYYESNDVAAIGIGAVILRGREEAGWVRGFSATRPAAGSASDHILRLFAAADLVTRPGGPPDLLDERFALVEGHRLEQTMTYGAEYSVTDVTMALAEGVGITARIDPGAVPLLFTLDRARPARVAAREAGVPEASALELIERLLERGLLERVASY